MSVGLTAHDVEARLREASRLAGSLRPEHRLATKVDLSGRAVARRLKEASDLLTLCRALSRAGSAHKSAQAHKKGPIAL